MTTGASLESELHVCRIHDGRSDRVMGRLFDLARRVPRNAGRTLIKAYRYTLSPLVGFHCRHLPTCSEYGEEALDRFGLWAGGWMTLARLLRCHPWGTSGIDRVPATAPAGARWYLPWRYGRWSWASAERQPRD
jgi:putative membrane protein insertion efficiency factor